MEKSDYHELAKECQQSDGRLLCQLDSGHACAVGNLTFTQELATAAQLSIGLAWANEPQYLGEVDQEISARIGLNYKFAPGRK